MKKLPLVLLSMTFGLFTSFASAHPNEEAIEVAETIINLSRSIINDISPPAAGAERIVTEATITDDGTTRTYNIEGQDVYHTGRVLSTYWIRLRKQITETDSISPVARPVSGDTEKVIEALLNGLYDIAEMDLDPRRVVIDSAAIVAENPLTLELIGENAVCRHVEQNIFKITITRHVERSRPSYDTVLLMPYIADGEGGDDQ